jgi:S-formylglutathione hydrolase
MTADWSAPAFENYLGANKQNWRAYDATALIEDGATFTEFLVDQGDADSFLENGLRPHLLQEACEGANIPLQLRLQPGYDHSYFFISTFMDDHLNWHMERLK